MAIAPLPWDLVGDNRYRGEPFTASYTLPGYGWDDSSPIET